MAGEDGSAESMTRRSRVGLLVGLAALAALVVSVVHFGDARRFVEIARGARPGWLLVGLGLQAATYATDGGVWWGVLRRAGTPRPFRELYGLSLVSLFTNQMVPTAGVAGTLVVVRALEKRGVPHPVALSAVLLDLIGYYAAFGVVIGFGLLVLRAHHDLSAIVLAMAAAIAALGIGICGGALWMTAPGRVVPGWTRRWPRVERAVSSLVSADTALLRSPTLLVRAFVLRGGNFALDGLTLWACLRAIGDPLPVPAAVTAFMVGSLARTLGVVPGGLGTMEGGTVAGLALFSVAVEPGLTATLLFRGLSFWLPMLPGVWLGHRFAREAAP